MLPVNWLPARSRRQNNATRCLERRSHLITYTRVDVRRARAVASFPPNATCRSKNIPCPVPAARCCKKIASPVSFSCASVVLVGADPPGGFPQLEQNRCSGLVRSLAESLLFWRFGWWNSGAGIVTQGEWWEADKKVERASPHHVLQVIFFQAFSNSQKIGPHL